MWESLHEQLTSHPSQKREGWGNPAFEVGSELGGAPGSCENNCEDSRLSLGLGEVAGAPEVPAGDGGPGLPFFCAAVHDVGFGEVHGSDFVGWFELAEGEGEAFADAVVVDREDVGTA